MQKLTRRFAIAGVALIAVLSPLATQSAMAADPSGSRSCVSPRVVETVSNSSPGAIRHHQTVGTTDWSKDFSNTQNGSVNRWNHGFTSVKWNVEGVTGTVNSASANCIL